MHLLPISKQRECHSQIILQICIFFSNLDPDSHLLCGSQSRRSKTDGSEILSNIAVLLVYGCFSTHGWSTRRFPPRIDHRNTLSPLVRQCDHLCQSFRTELNLCPPDQNTSALPLTPFMPVSWIPSQRRQSKWLGRRPLADQTQVATAPQALISSSQPTIHGLIVSMDARHTGDLGFDSLLGHYFKYLNQHLALPRPPGGYSDCFRGRIVHRMATATKPPQSRWIGNS